MPARQLWKDPGLDYMEVQNDHKPINRCAIDGSLRAQRIGVVDYGMNKCRDFFVKLPASKRIRAQAGAPDLIAAEAALVFR